jgi:hypothetical protein
LGLGAKHVAVVPCCQAELARALKPEQARSELRELFRQPLHRREYGSHLTNVLRCLRLQASGYHVNVTELVGWEHSLKNELIRADFKGSPLKEHADRLEAALDAHGLQSLRQRFQSKV